MKLELSKGILQTHWERKRYIRKRKTPTMKRSQENQESKRVKDYRKAEKGKQNETEESKDHEK